jgi:hypothetical protein
MLPVKHGAQEGMLRYRSYSPVKDNLLVSTSNPNPPFPPVPSPGVYQDQVRAAQQEVFSRGTSGLIDLANAFVPQVQAARAVLQLADLGFTSAELVKLLAPRQRRKLPADLANGVLDQIVSYQGRTRELIDWMAVTIEYYDYFDREQAAQALRAANTREFALALVSAERAMNVSARSFRLLSEVLVDFNRVILQKLPDADGEAEREVLFANAVLVYETLDFMVRYLEDYQIRGLPELEKLAGDVRQRTSGTLADIARQREATRALQVTDEQKQRIFREQDEHEEALKVIASEWASFMGEKRDLASSVSGRVANQLAILKVRRDGARTWIEVLGLAAITRMIRESITDMEQAVLEVASLDLAPLPLSRLHRLIGLPG